MEVSTLSHLTNSTCVVMIIKWLRGTARYQAIAKALPIAEGKVHVFMSVIGAAVTALGMHGAATGNYTAGWSITLAIPPLWIMAHAAWDTAQQFALNQIVYAVAVQQKAAAPVVTVPVAQDVTMTAALPKGAQ